MAETLISPGVLARENDSSQITSQPVQAGAAIVGPTVKGNVNIPTLVTTYSEYFYYKYIYIRNFRRRYNNE